MFDRVKLWGTGWETINMQTRMLGNKHLHFLSCVYRRIVPDQHHGARHLLQQISQEIDHLFAGHRPLVQFHPQFDLSRFRCYEQRPNQVGAWVMLEARPNGRRLTPRGPSPFEWTHQRFATFIEKNKGGAKGPPLFLSKARDNVSNRQWRLHPVAQLGVVAFGNST